MRPHGDVSCRVGRLLGDMLLKVALHEISNGGRIATGIDLALEVPCLVAGRVDAPSRVVSDEIAPAPTLEGIIEREGLTTVFADL